MKKSIKEKIGKGNKLAVPEKTKLAKKIQEEKKGKKVKEVAVDRAPTAIYGKGLPTPYEIPGFDVQGELDTIEKKIGIGSTGLGGKTDTRLSTGMLILDLIYGGGYSAGWNTNFGQEQSCKSTGAMTVATAAVAAGIPIITYSDYEGSTEPNYLQNMMSTQGLKADVTDVFGIRDRDGKYVKAPRIRYLPCDTAEQFFDYLAMLERALPDKVYQAGQWWFVYENTNDNRKKLSNSGQEYDKRMFSKHNKFYVPAQDGKLQALMITDSYPAMLPERLDVDEPGAGLAAVARMFAEQLPRVKAKMRRKRIAVLGINQLRDVPMARYGPPEKEAAGNAIKFFSDVRTRFTARSLSAIPDAFPAEKGTPFECEPSVEYEGGKDRYRYVKVKAEKNKFSTPYLEGFLRLWITDGASLARGFDPVFDTVSYLRETGQIKEKKKRKDMLLQLKGNEAKKSMDWATFKKLILSQSKDEIKAICTKHGMKPCYLRKLCFKQIKSGEGLDMFFDVKRNKDSKKGFEDSEDSSDD